MIGENSDVPRQSYCFATCNPRCESCANYRKWIELNQFPDALRKPLQAEMYRVDPFECEDLDGCFYLPEGEPT